jgi:hypothetical protein
VINPTWISSNLVAASAGYLIGGLRGLAWDILVVNVASILIAFFDKD